jgi:hypothetical protein
VIRTLQKIKEQKEVMPLTEMQVYMVDRHGDGIALCHRYDFEEKEFQKLIDVIGENESEEEEDDDGEVEVLERTQSGIDAEDMRDIYDSLRVSKRMLN